MIFFSRKTEWFIGLRKNLFDFAKDIVLVSRRLSDIQFKSEDLDRNVDENELGVRLGLRLVFNKTCKKQLEI